MLALTDDSARSMQLIGFLDRPGQGRSQRFEFPICQGGGTQAGEHNNGDEDEHEGDKREGQPLQDRG